ncbi:ImuA family protein [Caulobacter endophyticus]|uniref:Protein imuA n=1 Tax=Caulobacter endophyticus TaxID=2172652 RepID=A0A2T9JIT9_9CAUL|nr:protein imuA [Caulobacter endophyticus]PVM83603.1 protein imuA [Caulobacter endophyticus]
MPGSREARIEALRGRIAAIEAGTRTPTQVLPFGDPSIDGHLPGGGLPRAGWHEVVGEGLEGESGAATAAFAALLARPKALSGAAKGAVVWVLRRSDLYVPGLVNLGFPVERLVMVRVRDEAEGLSVLEDALATPGVAVAIGEAEAPDLVAGRRLQLACERSGGFGVVLHRRPYGGPARGATGSAAFSRWRVGPAPGRAPPDGLGLGPPAWRVALERCRGGRPGAWILEHSEADHGPHPFRVVSELADHDLAQTPPERLRRAG